MQHFFKHFCIVIVPFTIGIIDLYAQENTQKFNKQTLENPITYSKLLDDSFLVEYIPEFVPLKNTNFVLMPNGYAEYQLINKEDWSRIRPFINPLRIDIVFTNYPLHKEDWITNYYVLLSNRLKDLFDLDSTLNSNRISWHLLKQTNCKSGAEAKDFFHGIIVRYSEVSLSAIVPIPPQIFFVTQAPVIVSKSKANEEQRALSSFVGGDEDIMRILYPESVHNRKLTHYLPAKTKNDNDPDCPSFSTRMEKPRIGFWVRIFGR